MLVECSLEFYLFAPNICPEYETWAQSIHTNSGGKKKKRVTNLITFIIRFATIYIASAEQHKL